METEQELEQPEAPDGLCKCGCGQEVNRDWAPGHNLKDQSGENHPSWEDGRYTNSAGYILVHRLDHERSDANGYVREHLLVVEEVIGRPIPRHAEVHHVNGDRADNRPGNLVVCEDHGYHMLLEKRQRALEACGNPSWRKCKFCGEWDDPDGDDCYVHPSTSIMNHRSCRAADARERRAARSQGPRRVPKGEGVGTSRLAREQVLAIRWYAHNTELTQREIARRFDVSKSAVGLIVRRERWKHLPIVVGESDVAGVST